ncbi:MAG: DUF177 domain-containing protein [Pseudomonadota bacterium]
MVEADENERAGLASRFDVSAVQSLRAELILSKESDAIRASGTLGADLVQACAVSGDDFPVTISEPIDLRFVQESTLRATQNEEGEIEIDLTADESDEIEYSGDAFDLGEAVAQTLALAIDPYAEGPEADAARQSAGITDEDTPSGPLAEALAALKKD